MADKSLSIGTRASVALRQTYFAAQGHDRAILARLWSRADDLAGQAVQQGGSMPLRMATDRLQVRSEIERFQGNDAAAVATLRESVGIGRRNLQAARARSTNARDPDVLDAYGWLDGSLGMLTYALVRQGRSQEAINVAQANIALWRAGQISDGLGARWNYRLATSLISTQQYEAGLAAARLSDEMLQRAGSSAASHTRWLARQEVVRGLIGLRRWKEADESYREFLAAMPPDVLARTRASDWRLLALLAAQNGRLDEALETVERIHRYRTRLYGANHPQTQEAAGVRAVVRLLRGDVRQAMTDYEALFAATLDNPGGWLDLDLRGVRGYVFGIAFDQFMRFVAERAVKGEPVDPALTDRALQIADRGTLGATQRHHRQHRPRAGCDACAGRAARTGANSASGRGGAVRQAQWHAGPGRPAATRRPDRGVQGLARGGSQGAYGAPASGARPDQGAAGRARCRARHVEHPARGHRQTVPRLRRPGDAQHAEARVTAPPAGPRRSPARDPPDRHRHAGLAGGRGGPQWLQRIEAHARRDRPLRARTMLDLGTTPPGREPALQTAALHALYRELLGPLETSLRDVPCAR